MIVKVIILNNEVLLSRLLIYGLIEEVLSDIPSVYQGFFRGFQ